MHTHWHLWVIDKGFERKTKNPSISNQGHWSYKAARIPTAPWWFTGIISNKFLTNFVPNVKESTCKIM